MVADKLKPMLRTGLYKMPANKGKRAKVLAVFGEYRRTAEALGRAQWRLFFEKGRMNRDARLGLPTRLSARYVQTCQYQVVGQLNGFLGNCANAFKDRVLQSSVDEDTRIALLYLNKYKSWFKNGVKMQGELIPSETMKLARAIMRNVFKLHRKPNLSRINLALDEKVATVSHCGTTKAFGRWIKFSTLEKGKTILLPIADNTWFDDLPGTPKAFCQINLRENGDLWAGLVKDVEAAPYSSRIKLLGLDVGLTNLLASSEGDLLGRDVLAKLHQYDREISKLAANRQRAGLKPRSARYDRLVHRMRAYLKNEIYRTLRVALMRHKPETVAVERLDFRSPNLSRRMNRLVQNFGRREFKKALDAYADTYDFKWVEIEPAYSSQTCRCCGYVDARNRERAVFACLHCGHHEHADVHASRNLAERLREDARSSGSKWSGRRRARKEILGEIVGRFATAKRLARVQRKLIEKPHLLEQHERRDSTPCLVMLSNPHFDAVLEPVKQAAQAALATQLLAGSRV